MRNNSYSLIFFQGMQEYLSCSILCNEITVDCFWYFTTRDRLVWIKCISIYSIYEFVFESKLSVFMRPMTPAQICPWFCDTEWEIFSWSKGEDCEEFYAWYSSIWFEYFSFCWDYFSLNSFRYERIYPMLWGNIMKYSRDNFSVGSYVERF